MVREFGRLRGGDLFYPYIGGGFGAGPFVELADGSVKYDCISGIGVHHLGRLHERIVAALIDAALRDTVMQGNLQQNVESFHFSRELLDAANHCGADLAHCLLSTSGATANENALKLIFQKNYPADRILAFDGCFMGRTLTLSQITDKPDYREKLPQTVSVDYLPFYDALDPEGSSRRALERMTETLERYPDCHAALCCELVLGEGGFYPGTHDFFAPLMTKAKRHGIAVLVDEIQTFGRTGALFAFQHFGLDRYVDAVTVGKMTQVCATLFRSEFKPRPGLLSQTFTAGTAAILAGLTILRELREGGYFGPEGRIERVRGAFVARLQSRAESNPRLLAGPFGIGAMIACSVFEGDVDLTKRFLQNLFRNGVIAFYAGKDPARVRFLPPVWAMSRRHVDEVMDIFERTLAQTADETGRVEA